jgi:hypothetical protein
MGDGMSYRVYLILCHVLLAGIFLAGMVLAISYGVIGWFHK